MERQSSLLSLSRLLLAQLPLLPSVPFCGRFPKQAFCVHFPLTVHPNVGNDIDGWPQNSPEQSMRPSVREAE